MSNSIERLRQHLQKASFASESDRHSALVCLDEIATHRVAVGRDDGGPAMHMTLRDRFIAHAPVEPWEWFSPSMPAKPTPPPEFPVGNNGERPVDDREASALRQWVNDPVWDADIEHPAFSNWVKAWISYWDASLEWKLEQKKQTAIQWPAYWADQMLTARNQ